MHHRGGNLFLGIFFLDIATLLFNKKYVNARKNTPEIALPFFSRWNGNPGTKFPIETRTENSESKFLHSQSLNRDTGFAWCNPQLPLTAHSALPPRFAPCISVSAPTHIKTHTQSKRSLPFCIAPPSLSFHCPAHSSPWKKPKEETQKMRDQETKRE